MACYDGSVGRPRSTFPDPPLNHCSTMPFDPSLPADNSPLSSSVMRDQFNGVNEGSSVNTNAVSTLSMNAEANYDQNQMQAVIQKIDEILLTMRR